MEEKKADIRSQKDAQYLITGQLDMEKIEQADDMPLYACAVRERQVVGSALVEANGKFKITFPYRASASARSPFGMYVYFTHDLSPGQFIKRDMTPIYVTPQQFAYKAGGFIADLAWDILRPFPFDRIKLHSLTIKGYVYSCSGIVTGESFPACCPDAQGVSTTNEYAYVRLKKDGLVIRDNIRIADGSGSEIEGSFTYRRWARFPMSLYTAIVEVYQKLSGIEKILYSKEHTFTDGVAQLILVNRTTDPLVTIPVAEGEGSGDSFGFTRVGNIPLEYISQTTGRANSTGASGSATHKVEDYSFTGTFHLYGNTGVGLREPAAPNQCKVAYIRVRYETLDATPAISGYIQTPYTADREPKAGETRNPFPVFMGPKNPSEVGGMVGLYDYAYTYDTGNDWLFKGLMLVIGPSSLPYAFGRYRFTVEAYDASRTPIAIPSVGENDYHPSFVLRINNEPNALTGAIDDISGTGPCGFLNLEGQVHPAVSYSFDIREAHGDLGSFRLTASYGAGQSVPLENASGSYPTYPGITSPEWMGKDNISGSTEYDWVECAYGFDLFATRRLTDGFGNEGERRVASRHITILSDYPFTP